MFCVAETVVTTPLAFRSTTRTNKATLETTKPFTAAATTTVTSSPSASGSLATSATAAAEVKLSRSQKRNRRRKMNKAVVLLNQKSGNTPELRKGVRFLCATLYSSFK